MILKDITTALTYATAQAEARLGSPNTKCMEFTLKQSQGLVLTGATLLRDASWFWGLNVDKCLDRCALT